MSQKKSVLFYTFIFLVMLGVTKLTWSATVTANAAAESPVHGCYFSSEVSTMYAGQGSGIGPALWGFPSGEFFYFDISDSGDFDLIIDGVVVSPSGYQNGQYGFYGPNPFMTIIHIVPASASPGEQTDLTLTIYNAQGQFICSDTLTIVVGGEWSPWYDRDNPSGSGDWENRSSQPGVCQGQTPHSIEARTVGSHIPASQTGEIFSAFSADLGLVCRKNQQPDNRCMDYEVRYVCP